MRILDLPLKAKWNDMQESGEKPEEYREVTPYWCNRLLYVCPLGTDTYWKPVLDRTFEVIKENGERMPHAFNLNHLLIWQYGVRDYTHVRFRYGYPAWGAPTDRVVFIIKHHKLDE